MSQINLHGEADDMTDVEVLAVMDTWRKELDELIQEKAFGPACVYNSDLTGMFYENVLNSIFVDKNNKNDYKGTKQMKDKSRVTEMIDIAADGYRLPVAIIGKPKKQLIWRDEETPLPYKN